MCTRLPSALQHLTPLGGYTALSFKRQPGNVTLATKKLYPGPFEDVGTQLLRAPKLILTNQERQRLDESPDADFYSTPRLMQHADEAFTQALTAIYAAILPPHGCLLELCASRHSHLPDCVTPQLLVGQGMNAAEMAANPSLHQHFVQDLNLQPLLLEQLDGSYDAVLCVNGVQYLTQLEIVISEASRVLRPGGLIVIASGPDCFREKALAGWLSRSMRERSQLLQQVMAANGFQVPVVLDSPEAAAQFASGSKTSGSSSGSGSSVQHNATGEPQQPLLQVLVAFKSQDTTAGAAEADTAAAGVDMRPDNVANWFTKPGLAGLAEAASVQQQQQPSKQPASSTGQPPQVNATTHISTQPAGSGSASSSGSGSGSSPAAAPAMSAPAAKTGPVSIARSGGAVNERLLEQWHFAYKSLVNDAVDMGIPRSVIPQIKPDATPAELQEGVKHLQDMMASFLSSGL